MIVGLMPFYWQPLNLCHATFNKHHQNTFIMQHCHCGVTLSDFPTLVVWFWVSDPTALQLIFFIYEMSMIVTPTNQTFITIKWSEMCRELSIVLDTYLCSIHVNPYCYYAMYIKIHLYILYILYYVIYVIKIVGVGI